MIVGVGSDLFEIARMKRELDLSGPNLKRELFTPVEIAYCESKHYPERHYAARFAAKEALFKALATGLQTDMNWLEAEIRNRDSGQPYFILSGRTSERALNNGVKNTFVSISHTEKWAFANVILEG
jgi:holo-[acyl-carrier protein] synthase